MSAGAQAIAAKPRQAPMSGFERYLTLWVALCIVAGVALGQGLPDVFQAHRPHGSGPGQFAGGPADLGNDRPDAGQDRLRGAAPGQRALARHRRHAVRELGRQAILDGPAGVAVHPTSVRSVPAGRSTGQLHRGLDLAGRRALHGNGVRVEPPYQRRPASRSRKWL